DLNENFQKLRRLAGYMRCMSSKEVQEWCKQINQCTTTGEKITALITAQADFHALVAPDNLIKAQAVVSSCTRVHHLTAGYREDIALEPVCIVSSFSIKKINVVRSLDDDNWGFQQYNKAMQSRGSLTPLTIRPQGTDFYLVHDQTLFHCQISP